MARQDSQYALRLANQVYAPMRRGLGTYEPTRSTSKAAPRRNVDDDNHPCTGVSLFSSVSNTFLNFNGQILVYGGLHDFLMGHLVLRSLHHIIYLCLSIATR